MAQRLNSWLVSQGGVRDPGGDVFQTIGGFRGRPGLLNSRGITLDDAALRAWEEGYFPEHGMERPSINDLLELIGQDHNGRVPVYPMGCVHLTDGPSDPALALLARMVSVFRAHGDGGKRKAMRPLLREAEMLLEGAR